MTAPRSDWAAPERAWTPQPSTGMTKVLQVIGVPVMALGWWALAFLPWKRAGFPPTSGGWLPTLPVVLGDLGFAVFGPLGASIVVVAVLRRWELALGSVLLGYVGSVAVTLGQGRSTAGNWSSAPFYVNASERTTMLGICVITALAGVAIGAVAVGSLRRFGFLGLLAASPVVSLIAALFLDPRADQRWLTRPILVALLVMIAWRRWSGVLLWPAFLALYWLLALAMTAVDNGAQILRHRGGGTSVADVADSMLSVARSAWRVLLEISWNTFWPAAVVAGLVVAGPYVWRRARSAVHVD
ncbi:MAG: hypothetical protein HHJ11_15105 [Phycicoccus sp.]|nr:hypothetical protein [Phycicoccus sp.]NMM35616.1 hypothetical protein [Phycicoccus sp.]